MRYFHTIRLRLTAWGAGITLLVCLLVCSVLYAGARYSLHHEVDSFLREETHEFLGVVREHEGDAARAEEAIRLHLDSRSSHDLCFRVLDEHANTLIRSDTADPLPVSGELIARVLAGEGAVFETLASPGGPTLRVCSMPASAHGRRLVAQASCSLDRVNASLASLQRSAAITMSLGVLLAMLAGRVLAARSLAPLEAITSTAERITAQRLSERVPRSGNGDEFDRLAAVLNDLLDRIEQYVARMQQFTADASHELRSPLAALRGNAEVSLSRNRSAAELRRVLEESIEYYDQLIRIADDLLLLARVDSGQAAFRMEPVEWSSAIEDVIDLFMPLASERGLTLSFVSSGSMCMLGDPGRLRQVVSNLLDNAIKYTPALGSVDVRLSEADGFARLEITDSGMGIDADHLPHVFNRFYRVDRARSRSATGGVGLGLAICRSIVESHQGSITMSSQPGNGTTVVVDLRLIRNGKASDAATATMAQVA